MTIIQAKNELFLHIARMARKNEIAPLAMESLCRKVNDLIEAINDDSNEYVSIEDDVPEDMKEDVQQAMKMFNAMLQPIFPDYRIEIKRISKNKQP